MAAPTPGGGIKTLAIRLDMEIHAQLTMIAALRSTTITDEIKAALAAHIDTARATDDLAARASDAAAEIEQEAATRKAALASLFDTGTKPTARQRSRTAS